MNPLAIQSPRPASMPKVAPVFSAGFMAGEASVFVLFCRKLAAWAEHAASSSHQLLRLQGLGSMESRVGSTWACGAARAASLARSGPAPNGPQRSRRRTALAACSHHNGAVFPMGTVTLGGVLVAVLSGSNPARAAHQSGLRSSLGSPGYQRKPCTHGRTQWPGEGLACQLNQPDGWTLRI